MWLFQTVAETVSAITTNVAVCSDDFVRLNFLNSITNSLFIHDAGWVY